jgi:hypothetical protein
MHPTWCIIHGTVHHLRCATATNPPWFVAERKGCARSLRSLRLPLVAEPLPLPKSGKVLIPHSNYLHFNGHGGERGIRTLGPDFSRNTRFPVVPLRPLGHLSVISPTLGPHEVNLMNLEASCVVMIYLSRS